MKFTDSMIPYFCWDRALTAGEIRGKLARESEQEKARISAWIMREAATPDVWQFITPQYAWRALDAIRPFLGRRRTFWEYILSTWHELGRI
jgi:hypothetical protein